MRQRGFPHRFSHEQFIAEFAPLVQSLNPTALKPTAAAPLPRDVCRMIAEQVGLLRRLASAPHACACAHPCVRVYISSERLQRRTSGALQSEVNAALGRSRAVPSAPPIVVGSSAILQSMLSSVAIGVPSSSDSAMTLAMFASARELSVTPASGRMRSSVCRPWR